MKRDDPHRETPVGPQGLGVIAPRARLGGRGCHPVDDPGTAETTHGDFHEGAVAAARSVTAEERGAAVCTPAQDRVPVIIKCAPHARQTMLLRHRDTHGVRDRTRDLIQKTLWRKTR
ncbi:hypothetical protein [Streptomyces sp. NBC_00076]|uniref:hypothetical protein n=1 Tax=Streptomyces sp. NBC_00076 TaxID=2975642 RepID=UPI0038694EBF